MEIQKKLYWLMQAGITCFCGDQPASQQSPKETKKANKPIAATEQASQQASQAKDLPTLNKEKVDFTLSSLKKTATHTVLGLGPTHPKLMCILEMPDSDSDKAGNALAGAQATLLTKMMKAIQLNIDTEVYITYLSPWRSPGSRPLTKTERALFYPFIAREIQLVQPQSILLFGASAVQTLLAIDSLSKARGTWHTWQGIPCRATLAPSTLKTTSLRQQAWTDLQEVQKKF